jgi:hypothetical protein
MPFDFPNTPAVGAIVVGINGATWRWDGFKWVGGMGGPYLPLSGGTMTGPLNLANDPVGPNEAVTKNYADHLIFTVPNEAPMDGQAYGRELANWTPVMPKTGGVLEGDINVAGFKLLGLATPVNPADAATKSYVDSAIAGGGTITLLGTVTTGVWHATPIDIPYGGTNATTAAAARTNLGAFASTGGTITGATTVQGTVVFGTSGTNNALTITPGAATSNLIGLAQSGTGGVYVSAYLFCGSGFQAQGAFSTTLGAAKTVTAYTVVSTDTALLLAPTGTMTITLPTASAAPGRQLILKLTTAFAVNSATANVVPLVGGAATTAIMPATAGKFCMLQSDGTNWQIMQAN